MPFEALADELRGIRHRIHGVPAETGQINSDGNVIPDARVDGEPNKIWARINGERHSTAVWNLGRYPAIDPEDAPQNIRVALNAQGEWEVSGSDSSAANTADGAVAASRLFTRLIGKLLKFVLPARNFYPGRLHPYPGLGALHVGAYDFFYKDTAGATKYWADAEDNAHALDLTSNIPAASGGFDTWRYVVVCLNPDATTPALVAVNGTEQFTSVELAVSDIASIAITDGYYPLAAVKLTTGDTGLNERNIVDFRLWLDKDGAAGVGDFLANGSIPMTGDLNLGGNDINSIASVNLDQLVFSASTELTIASGAVTAGVKTFYRIDTESDAASDDLDTINGGAAGEMLIIRAENTGRTVVVTTAGNIVTPNAASIALDETYKMLWLIYDGGLSKWVVFDGTGATPYARTLLDDADATAARSTLGLGTIATQNANNVSISGGAISGITDLAIADGGTGASTATAAFNALSPITTKGDLISRDGTNNIRVAVGSNGRVLIADSAETPGIRWGRDPSLTTFGMVVKNTSGATVAAGDVGIVIYDATNGDVYNRTTTANYPDVGNIAVVLIGGADAADIYVSQRGRVTLNYAGTAPNAGQWLTTSTTGGSAQRSTTMRPEIFAVAEADGSGGTVQARLYTQTQFVPFSSTNNLHQVLSASDLDFVATINGAPSATSVVYNAPSSGAENVINVGSSSELAKLVLWNSTRSTGRLISSVNTGTNTITTVSSTDAWASTDSVTIRSQTNTDTVGTSRFCELDLSQTTEIPLHTRALVVFIIVADSGGAGENAILHPYEAGASSKRRTKTTQTAQNIDGEYHLPLYDRRFTYLHTATGAGTFDSTLRVMGYFLAVP